MWTSNTPASGCMHAFFMSVVLVAPQPTSVRVLNQMTSHSIQFTSLPGQMTSIFNHFKSACQSKKLKTSSWVVNLVQKPHARISRKNNTYVVTVLKGVHANKTMGVENNVAGRLKLAVFLECAQYWESFHESRR